jgi:hypothetical protein
LQINLLFMIRQCYADDFLKEYYTQKVLGGHHSPIYVKRYLKLDLINTTYLPIIIRSALNANKKATTKTFRFVMYHGRRMV